MTKKNLIIIGIVVLVIAGLVYLIFQGSGSKNQNKKEVTKSSADSAHNYVWSFVELGIDKEGIFETAVSLTVDDKLYTLGKFGGSCHEIKPGETGILSEPADANEVIRAQCWFAGSGDEIGVFKENGKLIVKSGELGEGDAESPAFRGNFKTLFEI